MNPHRRLRPLLAAFVVALVAAACGGDSDSGGDSGAVIASLGDREFTQSELDDLLPDGDNTVASRIVSVVESWLTQQALELELADLGFAVSDEDRDAATDFVEARDAYRNDTERDVQIQELANSAAIGRWLETAIEDAGDPELPNYLCANHILVETEEEAADALQRYIDGEPFADLAIELSTGPSGPNGGDLGCAREGSFVPEFEEVAYAGTNGEVVGPVETDFGWHVIEVETVGPATVENHPEADPVELAQLASEASRDQIDTLVFELQQQAGVNQGADATVDASIGTLDGDGLEITGA